MCTSVDESNRNTKKQVNCGLNHEWQQVANEDIPVNKNIHIPQLFVTLICYSTKPLILPGSNP
jgi:hypothetical protein